MHMRANIRVVSVVVALFIGVPSVAQSPEKQRTASFSKEERDAINSYYKHLHGILAPGSLDRAGFSPEIEKALTAGGKVPLQLEKRLERLPRELEGKLSTPPPGYERYLLGRHVLLVQRSNLVIGDIVRDAGWK